MKKIFNWIAIALVSLVVNACQTEDVNPSEPDNPTQPSDLHKISDLAFAEYLAYNSSLKPTDANYLPEGSVVKLDGEYYIDKTVAATATAMVYLVKDETRMSNLEKAGVATARVKIVNIDGLQFFTQIKEVRLTSNAITGSLDLSMLTKLETLEMNGNFVSSLTLPSTIKRLRYSASTAVDAPDNRWLTAIDLSKCNSLVHVYLPDHHIVASGLKLPSVYPDWKDIINFAGNTDAPFTIPEDLYNQFSATNRLGVTTSSTPSYDGPQPQQDYFEIPDLAFAEYLYYNTTLAATDANYLPTGSVIKYTNGKHYINKATAATATGVVYASKSAAAIKLLPTDQVPTAADKIKSIAGIEYFTNMQGIVLTSNELTGALDFSAFTKLETIEMNSNFVNGLKVPASLVKLSFNASTSSSAPADRWLTAIDFSACSNLNDISLINHKITTDGLKLPTVYTNLKSIDLTGNTGAPFAIPASLFNQLTKKNGVVSQ